ncbi:MAG: Stp1/IreP family PP2C-type Ser/Thr phosphatase [Eubacteriales bacterium]
MKAWGLTDVGNIRKQNQDHFAIEKLSSDCIIAVVCDGMGGAKAGNVASKLATEIFIQEVQSSYRPTMSIEAAEVMLRHSVSTANQAVFEQAEMSVDFRGMGTTLVAAYVTPTTAIFANVGDSRGYILNETGISFMTVDHSQVEFMVRRGDITRQQAMHHPQKNFLTRALGTDGKISTDVYRQPLGEGDAILLCSDGLSNVVTDQEMIFEVVYGVQKEGCCQSLLKIAKDRGAPDNVTVLLVTL